MEITATSLLVCPGSADPPTCDWMATVTWGPANDHAEQDFTIELIASDTGGQTATQSYVLHVNNTNDPPVAEDDVASTAEDTAVIIDVLANR